MALFLKLLHISFVSIWLAGAVYLPVIFRLHRRAHGTESTGRYIELARRLYFELMTPSAVIAVVLGTWLIFFGFEGGWLPVKLALVLLLALFHLYCGRLLLLLEKGQMAHRAGFLGLLAMAPVPLLLAIVALAVTKPF